MAAAGQLWSTVADLGRFAAFLVEPDPDVLAGASVDEMTVPRSGTSDAGATVTYGLGTRLLLTSEGRGLVGHTGSMPGFLAGLFVDRARHVGAVCLANATAGVPVTELPQQLLGLLEQEEPTLAEPWQPIREIPGGIADVLGVWHWGELPLEMRYDAGELQLRQLGTDAAMRYRPTTADTYIGVSGYHTGETLRVVRGTDGRVSHLECATFVYTTHGRRTTPPPRSRAATRRPELPAGVVKRPERREKTQAWLGDATRAGW
jgi:CubicO group peptidase (beta-lactamase class C family)